MSYSYKNWIWDLVALLNSFLSNFIHVWGNKGNFTEGQLFFKNFYLIVPFLTMQGFMECISTPIKIWEYTLCIISEKSHISQQMLDLFIGSRVPYECMHNIMNQYCDSAQSYYDPNDQPELGH